MFISSILPMKFCNLALPIIAVAALIGSGTASATPLSLIGESVTINGTTFSFTDCLCSDESKIDISFIAGDGFVGFNLRPISLANNPWSQTGPGGYQDTLEYSVEASAGANISAALTSATYSQRYAVGTYIDTIAYSILDDSTNVFATAGCRTLVGGYSCNEDTGLGGVNITPVSLLNVRSVVRGSVSPESTGGHPDYSIVSGFQQIFLLNSLSISTIVNPLPSNTGRERPYAVLSDGRLIGFPIPEPSSIALSGLALAALAMVRRRG